MPSAIGCEYRVPWLKSREAGQRAQGRQYWAATRSVCFNKYWHTKDRINCLYTTSWEMDADVNTMMIFGNWGAWARESSYVSQTAIWSWTVYNILTFLNFLSCAVSMLSENSLADNWLGHWIMIRHRLTALKSRHDEVIAATSALTALHSCRSPSRSTFSTLIRLAALLFTPIV